jgi:hypothetical protein
MKKIKNEGFLSQAISEFLKDKLKDFFINIEFTMSNMNLIQVLVIIIMFFSLEM